MRDDDLLHQFLTLSLPIDQWTHRAHVKVAFLLLREHGLDEGIERIAAGIRAYNAHNDVPEGPLTGYNHTTTVAFAHLIHATDAAYGTAKPTPTGDDFCDMHPHLMQKTILRLFYTPDQRIRPDAKTGFVEPDLAPFPRVPRPAADAC